MALDYSFYLHPLCNIYFGIIFANFCHLFFATPTEIAVCVCVGAHALLNVIFRTHGVRRYYCYSEHGGDDGNGGGQYKSWGSLYPSTLCMCVCD